MTAVSGDGERVCQVVLGDLDAPDVIDLLALHATQMLEETPPESAHFLDALALREFDVTFWTAHLDGDLAGCGALRELDAHHGEIKSMRTAPTHLRKGAADTVLTTIVSEARVRGYRRLSLETGSGPTFDAAERLYLKHGFVECGPFADYRLDPHSRFMTVELD